MSYVIYSIHLGCFVLIMSSIDAIYPSSYIINAKNILQAYTGIKIRSVVIPTPPNETFEDTHLHDMLLTYATSSRSWNIYLHQIPNFKNVTRMARSFDEYYWPSLIIVNELSLTSIWPVDLRNIQFQDIPNKIWLIVLSSKYDNQEHFNEAMKYKLTSLHGYLLQNLINSQIYVMVRLARTVQLLEIYHLVFSMKQI